MRAYLRLRSGSLEEVKGEVVREYPLTIHVNPDPRPHSDLDRPYLVRDVAEGRPHGVASRTSPTEMAIGLAEQLGVTVVGYLRGETLNLYTGGALDVDAA